MNRLLGAFSLALTLWSPCIHSQVIVFESNGLKYQTLTKSGVTVMYAHLAPHIHQYTILQVAVTNGSQGPYVVRPEDFTYIRDTSEVRAVSAKTVIQMLIQKGSGSDVSKLVTAYENWVSGIPSYRATNGFEQRRQSALGMGGSRLRSAAAASAIAFVQTKLAPGETTDGAVFFPSEGKPLVGGHLVVRTNTDLFEFNAE
jgi:hypothetical protein